MCDALLEPGRRFKRNQRTPAVADQRRTLHPGSIQKCFNKDSGFFNTGGRITFTSAMAVAESFGVIGDCGMIAPLARKTRLSMDYAGITQLILPGDNIYDVYKSYDEVWRTWINRGFKFGIVAIGNHTLGYKEEARYFGMPAEYYTTTRGPARRPSNSGWT